MRLEALRESQKALDLMSKSVLSRDEQEAVVRDCVTNFDDYVNPGILEYRKSVPELQKNEYCRSPGVTIASRWAR